MFKLIYRVGFESVIGQFGMDYDDDPGTYSPPYIGRRKYFYFMDFPSEQLGVLLHTMMFSHLKFGLIFSWTGARITAECKRKTDRWRAHHYVVAPSKQYGAHR